MLTIWKYRVVQSEDFYVMMPEGATILTVQVQQGNGPQMWALVDPDNEPVARYFALFGTGHEIDPDDGKLTYVGTFQIGIFVYHLFERLGEQE